MFQDVAIQIHDGECRRVRISATVHWHHVCCIILGYQRIVEINILTIAVWDIDIRCYI